MNRITPAPRRVLWMGVSLVLMAALWVRPARAVDSKDVNVVNIPTVDARQSGAWDVGIDRARIPFQEPVSFSMSDGEPLGLYEFVVPAGHRLVIEQVTSFTQVPAGQAVWALKVMTRVGGVLGDHFIPATSAYIGFIGCQQVRLYADPETTVTFLAFRTGSAGPAGTFGSISGYLVPTP
jgi:hypothetical protein